MCVFDSNYELYLLVILHENLHSREMKTQHMKFEILNDRLKFNLLHLIQFILY